MNLLTQLWLKESELAPGAEWREPGPEWQIVLAVRGHLYWIGREKVHELQPGEVLVLGPAADGVLRASQINRAQIIHFQFQPEALRGVISLQDLQVSPAFAQPGLVRILKARDRAAQEFTAIAARKNGRGFLQQCRVLNLLASIFGESLAENIRPAVAPSSTVTRFEEILSRIPEEDLIHYSSEKLAEMCGCSLRHFRRMFRKQFKTSIRTRQTELRLEKARRLLAETDEKIASVAQAVGYRHMGLFNVMFKKRFGLTPSECRHENARSSHAAAGPGPAPVSGNGHE